MDIFAPTFIVANLGITIGYLFLAVRILPAMNPTTWQRKVGGFLFFFTCGLTHAFMALMALYHIHWHDTLPWWFWLNHIVQFVAVWVFIWGLYIEFVERGKTK